MRVDSIINSYQNLNLLKVDENQTLILVWAGAGCIKLLITFLYNRPQDFRELIKTDKAIQYKVG